MLLPSPVTPAQRPYPPFPDCPSRTCATQHAPHGASLPPSASCAPAPSNPGYPLAIRSRANSGANSPPPISRVTPPCSSPSPPRPHPPRCRRPHPQGLTLIVLTPTFCSSGKNTKICRQGVVRVSVSVGLRALGENTRCIMPPALLGARQRGGAGWVGCHGGPQCAVRAVALPRPGGPPLLLALCIGTRRVTPWAYTVRPNEHSRGTCTRACWRRAQLWRPLSTTPVHPGHAAACWHRHAYAGSLSKPCHDQAWTPQPCALHSTVTRTTPAGQRDTHWCAFSNTPGSPSCLVVAATPSPPPPSPHLPYPP